MIPKKIPLTIDGINNSIYAGFWLRLCSLLLDYLFLIPFIFATIYINGLSKNAYYFYFIPSHIFYFWFSIYLVKRYGGTPGKLLVGIKILKIDGNKITWKEAVLRESIYFIIGIFGSAIQIIALSKANSEHFDSLPWMKKQPYIVSFTPILFEINDWIGGIWICSELLILLFNKRRRALHDYIANTVIVKIKYINKIREVMSDNNLKLAQE